MMAMVMVVVTTIGAPPTAVPTATAIGEGRPTNQGQNQESECYEQQGGLELHGRLPLDEHLGANLPVWPSS
jgi:hypothetical protein